MSCDWDILCVDCNVTAGIAEANHELELMRALISQASALGAISKHPTIWELELRANGCFIPLDFFREHHTHHLRPVDEYGKFDTVCTTTFYCNRCGCEVQCEEREHPQQQNKHGHWFGAIWHWA